MAGTGRSGRGAAAAAGVLALCALGVALPGQRVASGAPPDPGVQERSRESVPREELSAPLWTNDGAVLFESGPVEVTGHVENSGTIEIRRVPARFRGPVVNGGMFKITDTEVHFDGGYEGTGTYVSDPSDNHFTDLVVGGSGTIVCGPGDNFFVSGDFINTSTNNTGWETSQCYLEFRTGTDTLHELHYPGADMGPSSTGYVDNFAWGVLHIRPGNTLQLFDGNAAPGGALYVGEITGVVLSGSAVTNISGAEGLNIYYDPELPGNAPLGGQTYNLGTSGRLIPIATQPVPSLQGWRLGLLAILLAGCGVLARRAAAG